MTLADVDDEPQADGLPGWTGEPAALIYTNSMAISAGPFDVTLVFGHQDHTGRTQGQGQGPPGVSEVARVAMSWGHLKSMIPLLARVVAEYEQQLGEIPAPGFDQNWRA